MIIYCSNIITEAGAIDGYLVFENGVITDLVRKDVEELKADIDMADKTIIPGRVWVKGLKTGMKVCWKNPANLEAIDGVIVLRATGSSKEFKEVKRLKFKTVEDGETVVLSVGEPCAS